MSVSAEDKRVLYLAENEMNNYENTMDPVLGGRIGFGLALMFFCAISVGFGFGDGRFAVCFIWSM